MIEPMKKVILVTLDKDRQETLEKLRELKLFHVQTTGNETSELNDAVRSCESLQSALFGLQEFALEEGTPGEQANLPEEQLAQKAESSLKELEAKRQHVEHLGQVLADIAPWGDFDPEQLTRLAQAGLHVLPCACPPTQMPDVPEGVTCHIFQETSKKVTFVLISDQPFDELELPLVRLPEKSPSQLRQELEQTQKEISELEQRLSQMASRMSDLRQALLRRMDLADFLRARDSMGEEGRLVFLQGYVPARRENDLRKAAHQNGWALLLTEPEEIDRDVPTLLTVPKWLEVSRPIFDFVGIQPGYREFDISAWFLIFLTIFFAMIFGDGGYGALLFIGLLAGRILSPKLRTVSVNLLLIFSFATIIWGSLTGTFFGMDRATLPPFLRGLEWFTSEENSAGMKNTQHLCFLIGAIHLSIGHAWRGMAAINSLKCLSQVGWIAILWGNFFLGSQLIAPDLYPFPSWGGWLYLAGAGLVLVFTNPTWKLHRAVGSGIGEILSNGVNSFVDVLSYIRLFAVGLSSFYVANSFNKLGTDLMGGEKGAVAALLTMIAGVAVILFGHVLNLALASLGVLVHGIRLNTLEFSGHINIEWAGIAFKPFARRSKQGEAQS